MNGAEPLDIAVIGLGLIGGSALRALAAAGHRVLGYDADPTTRATARTAAARAPQGARWQVTGTVADAVSPADVVLLAVPLPAVEAIFGELATSGYSGLVTDVTSVKQPVRELAAKTLHAAGQSLAGFVGGHPMAGRERSGFGASEAELFDGCAWVLCLEEGTGLDDWLRLAALFTAIGARVVPTTADEHDRAVAAVSHVPHLLAASLAGHAANDPLALTLGAGSFRDGTRVAASRPGLVAAMCGGNAEAARHTLDAVIADLQAARAALDGPDPIAALEPWLTPGYTARSRWPVTPGTPEPMRADPSALRALGRAGGWVTTVDAARRTVVAVRPA
ncbi:prephenate dehydrogenase [Virgisporangium aliadipatigenens]|uniref:Prephenate dehydrogenase n=1 Tax=Virgisporangium aliadipatigenens TaxID=741659 RepID=A0A8J3YWC1_9ACTN|nr:prephenate dehydrogenase/arogenate dehydrogenase family protein [Virgisporangium aliadipatigenens]GIJ51697.1 prephenate dehydrogenase [Virgisporangium aliadipatigenens]